MAAAVAVVGAGVCGLSTAVCILQRDPNVWVTVIADKFYPDTCTDGAAGVIMPWTSVKPLHLQRLVLYMKRSNTWEFSVPDSIYKPLCQSCAEQG